MAEGISEAGVGRPLSILIVDDSAMMRAMIRRVADLANVPIAHVYEAANGAEAIGVLEAHWIDAIFTDINMPVMTGTELLREIERRPEWQHMARVIISTDGSLARAKRCGSCTSSATSKSPFVRR